VVLQKPLALTLDEADRISAAVDNTACPLPWPGKCGWIRTTYKSASCWPGAGSPGVHGAAAPLPVDPSVEDFDQTWHVQPQLNRDIFADDAAHAVDFLYWLFGLPESVSCEIGTLLNPKIPNDNGNRGVSLSAWTTGGSLRNLRRGGR